NDNPISVTENAHEHHIFALDWHPLGHILVTGSNDHTTRFWTRNRPGDNMIDRLKGGDSMDMEASFDQEEVDESEVQLPGLGGHFRMPVSEINDSVAIPGLGGTISSDQGRILTYASDNGVMPIQGDLTSMDRQRAERLMTMESEDFGSPRDDERGFNNERRRGNERGRRGGRGARGGGNRERYDRTRSPDGKRDRLDGNNWRDNRNEQGDGQRNFDRNHQLPPQINPRDPRLNVGTSQAAIQQQILQQLSARGIPIHQGLLNAFEEQNQ
ncbi:hypothetical protein HK096_006922, partial [Nowakowskiella sp. JEL0078]